ncbi:MAG: DUF1385 domain-containing protein [Candidatus Nealsonbacteria bacterium]|nr:DUF1385 domain-containing protein [Candidatus Nealsonbacteria bacterium]
MGGFSSEGGIMLYSKRYDIKIVSPSFERNIRRHLIFLSLAISFIASVGSFLKIPVFLVALIILGIFVIYVGGCIYLDYQLYQWHAAEHKLIYLLENGIPLTLENLIDAPMSYIPEERCGDKNRSLKNPSIDKLEEALRLGKLLLDELGF